MTGRRRLAALWVALQVLLLAGWAWREEVRSVGGTTVLVAPEPVDPRDLLRGQYLELRYAFSRPLAEDGGEELPEGSAVWVVLHEEGGLGVPARASARRPAGLAAGETALCGTVRDGRFVFGVEKYFVPEGTETPSLQDTLVRLRIGDDGAARIDTLFVNGSPWP